MKKNIIFILALLIGFCGFSFKNAQASNSYYTVTPKAPAATASVKPGIAKYKQQNYVGAMQDLEAVLKKEPKNQLCKYYLALSYARLGYSAKATAIFQELSQNSSNEALKYYSKYALDCTGNSQSDICKAYAMKTTAQGNQAGDDMSLFIHSGQKIHPAAMDKITNERMIRKVQEAEYLMKQQGTSTNEKLKSQNDMPTNEEIINAINTLKKAGLDPISNDYTAYVMQGVSENDNYFATEQNQLESLNKYSSPEYLKMLMLSQMEQQNNLYANMFTYGI